MSGLETMLGLLSANKDKTYIDANSPVFSISNDQDRVNVKVYIEVNENLYITNSISVTYFRLSTRIIYYVCKTQSKLCSQENEVVYNNGQLIRYLFLLNKSRPPTLLLNSLKTIKYKQILVNMIYKSLINKLKIIYKHDY